MTPASGKLFLYLVQTAEALPPSYGSIVSPQADLKLLTWKKPAEDAIFLPKSSWNAGRNRLLAEAKNGVDYLYTILLDDDVVFHEGDFRSFEQCLLKYRPAVATPHFVTYPGNEKEADAELQGVGAFDAMFNAYHRDIIADGLILPYSTAFDDKSWWYSQLFVILLMGLLYPRHVVQFNRVKIDNARHGEYPKQDDFPAMQTWLEREAVRPAALRRRRLRHIEARLRHKLGLGRRRPYLRDHYRLPPGAAERLLRLDAAYFAARR